MTKSIDCLQVPIAIENVRIDKIISSRYRLPVHGFQYGCRIRFNIIVKHHFYCERIVFILNICTWNNVKKLFSTNKFYKFAKLFEKSYCFHQQSNKIWSSVVKNYVTAFKVNEVPTIVIFLFIYLIDMIWFFNNQNTQVVLMIQ